MGTSAWDLAPDFIVLIVSHNLYPDQPSFSTLAEMDKVIEEGREIFLFFVEKKNLFHLTVFFLQKLGKLKLLTSLIIKAKRIKYLSILMKS